MHMTWHYQILKSKDGYGLYEVYCGETNKFSAWTEEPMFGVFETSKEILHTLSLMQNDARKHGVKEMPKMTAKKDLCVVFGKERCKKEANCEWNEEMEKYLYCEEHKDNYKVPESKTKKICQGCGKKMKMAYMLSYCKSCCVSMKIA